MQSKVRYWEESEIVILREMKANQVTAAVIAVKLGRSRNSVISKLTQLGLGGGRLAQGFRHPALRMKTKPFNFKNSEMALKIFSEGKDLNSLNYGECKWPVGDLKEEGLKFCAAQCGGGVYCDAHKFVAYRSGYILKADK